MSKDKQVGLKEGSKQHIVLAIYSMESGRYENVEYKDIIGHQVGQNWVAVMTRDDETHIFKSENIDSIRVWKE